MNYDDEDSSAEVIAQTLTHIEGEESDSSSSQEYQLPKMKSRPADTFVRSILKKRSFGSAETPNRSVTFSASTARTPPSPVPSAKSVTATYGLTSDSFDQTPCFYSRHEDENWEPGNVTVIVDSPPPSPGPPSPSPSPARQQDQDGSLTTLNNNDNNPFMMSTTTMADDSGYSNQHQWSNLLQGSLPPSFGYGNGQQEVTMTDASFKQEEAVPLLSSSSQTAHHDHQSDTLTRAESQTSFSTDTSIATLHGNQTTFTKRQVSARHSISRNKSINAIMSSPEGKTAANEFGQFTTPTSTSDNPFLQTSARSSRRSKLGDTDTSPSMDETVFYSPTAPSPCQDLVPSLKLVTGNDALDEAHSALFATQEAALSNSNTRTAILSKLVDSLRTQVAEWKQQAELLQEERVVAQRGWDRAIEEATAWEEEQRQQRHDKNGDEHDAIEWQEQAEQLRDEMTQLQAQKARAEQSRDELQNQLEGTEQRLQDTEAEVTDLERQVQHEHDQLVQLQTQHQEAMDQMDQRVEELEHANEAYSSRVNELELALAEALAKEARANQLLDEKTRVLQEKEATITEQQATIQRQSAEASVTSPTRVQTRESCQNCQDVANATLVLEQKCAMLEKTVQVMKQEASDRQVKIAKLTKSKAELEEDKQGLAMALDAKQLEIQFLKRRQSTALSSSMRSAMAPPTTVSKSKSRADTGKDTARVLRSRSSLLTLPNQVAETPLPVQGRVPDTAKRTSTVVRPRRISFGGTATLNKPWNASLESEEVSEQTDKENRMSSRSERRRSGISMVAA